MMSRWEKFYKNSSGNHYPDRALITFFFKRLFKLKKKMLFLDLGCGTGSSFSLFSKKNIHVDSVDVSASAINEYKKKVSKNKFRFFISTFNKFFENNTKKYDFIYDGASLQHQKLIDIKKSYKLIYLSLKKGGYFLTIHLLSYKKINDNNFFVTKLNKKKIISLLKREKFKNIDYNIQYYTENNSKNFIKFSVISAKK